MDESVGFALEIIKSRVRNRGMVNPRLVYQAPVDGGTIYCFEDDGNSRDWIWAEVEEKVHKAEDGPQWRNV